MSDHSDIEEELTQLSESQTSAWQQFVTARPAPLLRSSTSYGRGGQRARPTSHLAAHVQADSEDNQLGSPTPSLSPGAADTNSPPMLSHDGPPATANDMHPATGPDSQRPSIAAKTPSQSVPDRGLDGAGRVSVSFLKDSLEDPGYTTPSIVAKDSGARHEGVQGRSEFKEMDKDRRFASTAPARSVFAGSVGIGSSLASTVPAGFVGRIRRDQEPESLAMYSSSRLSRAEPRKKSHGMLARIRRTQARQRDHPMNSNGNSNNDSDSTRSAATGPTTSVGRSSSRRSSSFGGLRTLRGVVTKQVRGDQAVDPELLEHYVGHDDLTRKPWYLISPQNRAREIWDWYMGVLLLVVGFYVPVRVALLEGESNLEGLDIFIQVCYWVDLVLHFVTGFSKEDSGEVCYDAKLIALNYLKGWFTLDFIATFPWSAFASSSATSDVHTIALLKLVRLVAIIRVYHLFNKLANWYKMHEGWLMVLRTLMAIVMVTHILGMGWHLIATIFDPGCGELYDRIQAEGGDPTPEEAARMENCPWLYRLDYYDMSLWRQYVASVYWALTTLSTVGYGDITARTVPEQLYAMTTMVIAVSYFAVTIGSWSNVLANFDSTEKAIRRRMQGIHAFIRDQKLPPTLAKRVRHHFRHAAKTNRWVSYDPDEIVGDLPADIRTQTILHVERKVVDAIPWFQNKERAFVADIVLLLQHRRYVAGDMIYQQGDPPEELFFLARGMVELLYCHKRVSLQEPGGIFGIVGLLDGHAQKMTARAVTPVVQVFALSREHYQVLASGYKQPFQELLVIAKRLVRELEAIDLRARDSVMRSKSLKMFIDSTSKPKRKDKGPSSPSASDSAPPHTTPTRPGRALSPTPVGSPLPPPDGPQHRRQTSAPDTAAAVTRAVKQVQITEVYSAANDGELDGVRLSQPPPALPEARVLELERRLELHMERIMTRKLAELQKAVTDAVQVALQNQRP